MPSDFKKEYQAYIEADMPDLWGRIEEGISEETGADTAEEQMTPPARKVIPWQRVVRRIGQVAAVAAIALISVNAIRMFSGSKSSAPMPAASDSAAPAYEAAAPASYDMEEAPAAEEPVMEAAEAPAIAEASEQAAAETAGPVMDAVNGSAAEASKAAEADGILMPEEAVLLSMEECTDENAAYRYALRFSCGDTELGCVLSEENAALAESQGIVLQPGGTYRIRVDVRRDDADPEYPYEILELTE